jgi:hypothetical protein
MRWRAVAAIVAVLFGVAGCGTSGIKDDRLNKAVAPTFANLYVLQQSLRGRKVTAASMPSYGSPAWRWPWDARRRSPPCDTRDTSPAFKYGRRVNSD